MRSPMRWAAPANRTWRTCPIWRTCPACPTIPVSRCSTSGTPTARWVFPLTHLFKRVDYCNGSASAMATGVFLDADGNQRSFFWSEPVRLIVHDHAETA